MEFDVGRMNGGAATSVPSRQTRQLGAAPVVLPVNIEAMINNLSAQVRQLNARLERIEASIPALAANDTKTAAYVNQLSGAIETVSAQTNACVKTLRAFARGGGVQAQQYVPGSASQAEVVYNTPPRGQPTARTVQPSADADDSMVDPGGPQAGSADGTEISYEDALFHGLIDDD